MKEKIERLVTLADRLLRPGFAGETIRPDAQKPSLPAGRGHIARAECKHCHKTHAMRVLVCKLPTRQGVPSLNAFGGFSAVMAALLLPLMALMTGCASLQTWASTHETELRATGKVLVSVAARAALNAAVSKVDEQSKSETLRTMAAALRQQSGAVVTADDVAKIINAWAPNDGEVWQRLSARVATVAAEELAAKGQANASKIAIAIADGLEQAAATAPATGN